MIWKNRRRPLDLSSDHVVMGILNTTPDSFSDGGAHLATQHAVHHAESMIAQGARIIDIGGESTRPGSDPVTVEEEMQRTVPVIEKLRECSDILISIDTSKAAVARAALEAGADIINDVTGLRDPSMVELAAVSGAGVCVMHMQGTPRTMQKNPDYTDVGGVLAAMKTFFEERIATLTTAGVDAECISLDPGIGFGKSLEDNVTLLRHLGKLQQDRPLLLGVSRKSCLGSLADIADPSKRDAATAVVTALAACQGIRLHRVHAVDTCVQALKLAGCLCP